ncbi:MAG: HD domain-containing protein [Bacteroidota bacterium]|nr:MAG: HD domain-containing protein [Bacteroidota bacterium]
MKNSVLVSMIEYFGCDVRRINHALKVYGFASAIGYGEELDLPTMKILEIAAALHDIGIPVAEAKYGSCNGKYQEIEGPPIAREILQKLKVESNLLDRVCYLIGNHHSYSKIDGIDFQILIEADFLVNIFEDQMSQKNIESIGKKYFKTATGLSILKSMHHFNQSSN